MHNLKHPPGEAARSYNQSQNIQAVPNGKISAAIHLYYDSLKLNFMNSLGNSHIK